jgi:hypothetical protein
MNHSAAAYTDLALVTNASGTYLLTPISGQTALSMCLIAGRSSAAPSTQSHWLAHYTLRSPRRREILCTAVVGLTVH